MSLFLTLCKAIGASAVTKARVLSILGASVAGMLIAFFVGTSDPSNPKGVAIDLVNGFGLNLIVPIAALVIGTAALGNPIEDGTYVYLWLRPIGRWKITFAAFAVTVAAVVPLAAIPTAISVLFLDSSLALALQVLFAMFFATVGYSAVFVLIGHLTTRGLFWGVGYLLIFEQFIARGGDSLGFFSMHSHAVSILSNETGIDLAMNYYRTSTGVFAILVAAGVFLGISTLRQSEMEVA